MNIGNREDLEAEDRRFKKVGIEVSSSPEHPLARPPWLLRDEIILHAPFKAVIILIKVNLNCIDIGHLTFE